MLLEISKSDVAASEILSHNGLYAQAVFHLQQAVEKSLKAVLIALKIAPEDKEKLERWLTKKLRHEIVTKLPEIAEGLFEGACGSIESLEDVENRQLALLLINSLRRVFKRLKQEFNEKIEKSKKVDITKNEDVDEFVNLILQDIQDRNLTKIKNKEEVIGEIIRSIKQTSISLKREQLPAAPDLIVTQLQKEIENRLPLITAACQLVALSLLLEKYAINSRYPKATVPTLGPHILKKGYPLVDRLELLQQCAKNTINQLNDILLQK